MTGGRDRTRSLAGLGVYLAISFLFFGLPVVAHPGRFVVGSGADPQIFIWSFAWWPHAILHGLNPFVTHAIWAPDGVNLAWTTSVPGLALVFAPLTLLAGPVVAYNLAAVLLPALAAWTAYLLCLRLTAKTWPSLLGGYLFGFSSYMLGQQLGHLHMTSVFLVPLAALLALRRLDGELSPRGFAIRLGVLLAVQISFSTELFFTLTLALLGGLAIAFAVLPASRAALASLLRPLIGAYALAAAIASPLLYYALTGFQSDSINSPGTASADLLNFVIPTGLTALSRNWGMGGVVSHFPGNDSEDGAYLGVPLLVIVALYAYRSWRRPEGRLLVGTFAIASFAALGTALYVGGHRVVALPWALPARLPVFDNVLPLRFVLYGSLAVSVMAALWLAASGPRWPRLALATLAVVTLFPHFGVVPYLGHGYWKTHPGRAAFFSDGLYRSCLAPNENVLIIPYGERGDSMLWQAEADFRFRMAEGYISPQVPAEFTVYPGFGQMRVGIPIGEGDVRRLAAAKGITTILVRTPGDAESVAWNAALPGWIHGQTVGGFALYRLDDGSARHPRCA